MDQKSKGFRDFAEEATDLNGKQALEEARRFPQPRAPDKMPGCPLGVDILGFVRRLRESDPCGALEKIHEKNSLAGVCGRVCTAPCEKAGALGIDSAVDNIRALERYASDHGGKKSTSHKSAAKQTGEKVAVVGSGPAGLMAAADLAKKGYQVTVFEALHLPGGVLCYEIPEFRLPKKILEGDLAYIRSLGVKIQTDVFVGQTYLLNELFDQGYSAILFATGAGIAQTTGIAGERLGGVYLAQELLMRVNLMNAHRFPKYATPANLTGKVVVIGADFAAFDCARIALRLGKDATLVYSRTEGDMEVALNIREQAKQEGLKIEALTKPLEIIGDADHCTKGLRCVRMDYADPESSGKWKLTPVKGTEFVIDADTVIISSEHRPNTFISKRTTGLKLGKHATIWTRKETAMTSVDGVFACGDVVSGREPLVQAMASGKKAAEMVDSYIQQQTK